MSGLTNSGRKIVPRFGIGGKDRGKEVFEEIIQAGLGPSQQEASSAAARMVTSLRVFSPSETSKAAVHSCNSYAPVCRYDISGSEDMVVPLTQIPAVVRVDTARDTYLSSTSGRHLQSEANDVDGDCDTGYSPGDSDNDGNDVDNNYSYRAVKCLVPMTPCNNTGHVHQHRPSCNRNMDPYMALGSSSDLDVTKTLVVIWTTQISMAPVTATPLDTNMVSGV
ncbi:hypothetical protein H671_2g5703 [Cricetulus griseus]|nr:hypothetical protein H671_2g5703 [Cricetulus griseus]